MARLNSLTERGKETQRLLGAKSASNRTVIPEQIAQ